MALTPRQCTDGFRWRCPRRGCNATKFIRDGSFTAGSYLSLEKLILIIFHWCFGVRLTSSMKMLSLGEHAIVDWHQFLRDECTWKLLQAPILLGGPGTIVEIDESLMIKRKYQRGAEREQHHRWVFGMYDRTTHVGIIRFVENREADTLLPIIQTHIRPGTTIYSDGWAAYNRIAQLGYSHEVVVHEHHFVDPVTGVHTNGVEAYWSRAKKKIKEVYGSRLEMIPSYLDEFLWRERNAHAGPETFQNMLNVIAEHYR